MQSDDTPTGAPTGGLYEIWFSEHHRYGGRAADFNKRKHRHLGDLRRGQHANPHMQSVYNKYRRFEFKIIAYIADAGDRILAEQKWLDENVGQPGCLNIRAEAADGQPYGFRHTAEAKAKIGAGNKGKIVSVETRQKLSLAHKGRVVPKARRDAISQSLKGKSLSSDSVAKISAKNRGQKRTAEQRARISASIKGHVHSAETKAKISAANKGNLHSEDWKRKMSAKMRGLVWITDGIRNQRLNTEAAKRLIETGAWRPGRCRKRDPELVAQIAEKLRGRKHSSKPIA